MCQRLWGVPNIGTLSVKPGRKRSTLSAWPLTSHLTCDIIRHINGLLGSAILKPFFSEGANFAIFSTDLRALLLCLLRCNLTQVGFETCWFWSAKKNLPRHPTFNQIDQISRRNLTWWKELKINSLIIILWIDVFLKAKHLLKTVPRREQLQFNGWMCFWVFGSYPRKPNGGDRKSVDPNLIPKKDLSNSTSPPRQGKR